MNKKVTVAVLTLTVGGLLFAQSALAYRGNPEVTGPNYSPERHEIMEKAFADNDYQTWKSQMQGRGRVTEVINQDNFSEFAKAHQLGNTDEAKAIREKLGLNQQNGSGQRSGYGRNR